MRIPRDLPGHALARALCASWGYREMHQSGSHIILDTDEPTHQRLSVPNHATLRLGTLNGLLRLVANHKGISREDILKTL